MDEFQSSKMEPFYNRYYKSDDTDVITRMQNYKMKVDEALYKIAQQAQLDRDAEELEEERQRLVIENKIKQEVEK